MKKIIMILAVLITVFLLLGCTQVDNTNNQDGEKLEVMASFYPFYDIAKNVAGDKANVNVLVPPAGEPHSFEPSPKDMLRVSQANVIIVTGTEFEEWEERIIDNVNQNAKIVSASNGIDLLLASEEHSHDHDKEDDHDEHSYEEECLENNGSWNEEHEECVGISKEICENIGGEFNECASACRHDPNAEVCTLQCVIICEFEEHHDEELHDDEHEVDEHEDEMHVEDEHNHGIYDPHFWVSPKNAIQITNNIVNALAEADPENKDYYIKNADEYKAKLQTLDNSFKTELGTCEKEDIIANHAAFAYLGKDYGFEQITIAGLSPESEPSASQIANLIEEAEFHGIKYIFYEELVDPRVSETIAKESGAQTLVLNPVAGSKDGKSYIEIMTQNLNNLKLGLECK